MNMTRWIVGCLKISLMRYVSSIRRQGLGYGAPDQDGQRDDKGLITGLQRAHTRIGLESGDRIHIFAFFLREIGILSLEFPALLDGRTREDMPDNTAKARVRWVLWIAG
jgi:hypothetical protein